MAEQSDGRVFAAESYISQIVQNNSSTRRTWSEISFSTTSIIIFPINLTGNHWTLLVSIKTKVVLYKGIMLIELIYHILSQVFDKDSEKRMYIDPLTSGQMSAPVDHIDKLRYVLNLYSMKICIALYKYNTVIFM